MGTRVAFFDYFRDRHERQDPELRALRKQLTDAQKLATKTAVLQAKQVDEATRMKAEAVIRKQVDAAFLAQLSPTERAAEKKRRSGVIAARKLQLLNEQALRLAIAQALVDAAAHNSALDPHYTMAI